MDATFAHELTTQALDKGADEVEVFFKHSRNLTVDVREQKVETLESSVTAGYGVRIIRDQRLGFSYSTTLAEGAAVVEQALEAAVFAEPDEHLGLPAAAPLPSVVVYDVVIEGLPEQEAIDRVLGLEKAALAEDSRIRKIRKASGSFTVNNTIIVNSRGIDCQAATTSFGAQIMAVAEDGQESQVGWDYEGSRFLAEVQFEEVGRRAARRALQLVGARKVKPAKGFILIDASVATDFLGLLVSALSAEAVQKGKSLLAGRVGQSVTGPLISIVDDGLIDGRLGSRPFDDEGVPTGRRQLIQQGVLHGFLHNTYTARKDRCSSTGNAARGGFAGMPSVGPTNLFAEPATGVVPQKFDSLVSAIDKGLYVIETMGMHTANRITGEFSVGAAGLWIQNGMVCYPVKEAVVSGTILDLFKNVRMIGDDLHFYGNIGSPSLLIEGIDISG